MVFIDTNIWVYALSSQDHAKKKVAVELIGSHYDSLVLLKPAGGTLDDGEGLRQYLRKAGLNCIVFVFHQLVGLRSKLLLFPDRDILS